jgi:AcrR family transcriptional regulator
VSRRSDLFDRRAPHQGDLRRDALLRALDELLREGDLDSIAIADISARAGVTRSAFYFYFENKAACVAALGAQMYRKAIAAADHLLDERMPPLQRIRAMTEDMFAAWEGQHHLYRATLEASRTSSALRELWDAYRESFVEPITAMIDRERMAGRAPAGPDSATLAAVLLDLSDRTLERLTPDDQPATRRRADTLVAVWYRTIYAAVEAPDERDHSAGPGPIA